MKEIKDSLKTGLITTETKTLVDLSKVKPNPEVQPGFGLNRPLKVGLFMGGASSEKEISLESARHVYNNLDREKYEVSPIFVDDRNRLYSVEEGLLWKNTTTDIKDSLSDGGRRVFYEDLKNLIDFAFIALHGKFGEEAFPALFEILSIPNNGASVLGGSLSMDKYRQRLVLMANGVDVPKFIPVTASQFSVSEEFEKCRLKIEHQLGYPFMVKPSREGSSTALHQVNSVDEIEAAFRSAFKFDNLILCEEVLNGKELTTVVYGLAPNIKALLPSELLKKGDYLTAAEKFLPGGAQMITPARLAEDDLEKVKKVSLVVFESLGLKIFSRIDSFWVEGRGVVVLEPNNPPAMTPSTALWLQAAEDGINAGQFLDEIISLGISAHAGKIGPL